MQLKITMIVAAAIGAMFITPVAAVAGGINPVIRPTPVVNRNVASVTYGPYVRFELGRGHMSYDDEHWLPPGYPGDPKVTFDLEGGNASLGAIAIGYDWMNGFRGDISLFAAPKMSIAGNWSGPLPGPHADITGGSVQSTGLMVNLFYSPLEQRGVNSRIQPFLVAGLGLSRNAVGDWTRTNPSAPSAVRTFEGDTSVSPAFSLGFGVSVQLTPPGSRPVMLEASYRYYNFGDASGGATPLAGNGSSPVRPLSFTPTDRVISISIRIPLKRL